MPSDAFSTAVLIGGPAASGKTTIARLLARQRGLRWYGTDAHGWSHRARAVAQGLHDEDDPTPGTFDRAPLINADLGELASTTPPAGTVVEGALITPEFAPLSRSVWLLPSATEQRRRLIDRAGTTTIHHGLIYGHQLISDQLAGTAATVINVDGQSIAETLTAVEAALASALTELPSVRSRSERQQVIRYGNRSLVDQLRSSIDNDRCDPNDLPVGTYDCECGLADCHVTVQLRPYDARLLTARPPGAIHAVGHDV